MGATAVSYTHLDVYKRQVQHGAGLGHTLGVPTINQLYPKGFQLPRSGIYITRTHIGGVWYPSATGLGSRCV